MRLANVEGRATLVADIDGTVRGLDLATISNGRFGPDVQGLYEQWDDLVSWAATEAPPVDASAPVVEEVTLGSPVPAPRQVFAIGLNYRSHAEESGMDLPTYPATFTKFPASLGGPFDDIELDQPMVDWEVELVAVIGRTADRVAEADGWAHVAGLAVGQDVSDRLLQFAAGAQFSLGKSRRSYGPIGPWLVTPDEFADPDDLALGCAIDGETVQEDRTTGLVFSVPRLVADLSAVLPLLPGDVIFTGTPAGIGATRQPARFLQPGETLTSWVEGIGTIRNRCVAPGA